MFLLMRCCLGTGIPVPVKGGQLATDQQMRYQRPGSANQQQMNQCDAFSAPADRLCEFFGKAGVANDRHSV
jgi:hypothetical protein